MGFRNRWLQLSCFLIGYDFQLLMQCSELSKKAVRKYSSAMILVMLIWGFVGYSFSNRYLGLNPYYSYIGAIIGLIVIIQIERQIILSNNPGWKVYLLRTIIAVAMALIGALIIDQIIFKNDIEKFKKNTTNPGFAVRSKEIDEQFNKNYQSINSQIEAGQLHLNDLESKRNSTAPTLNEKTNQYGFIPTPKDINDPKNVSPKYGQTSSKATPQLNPVYKQISEEINNTNSNIRILNLELQRLNDKYKDEKTKIKAEINKENPGFIEELNYMIELIQQNGIVKTFWILWIVLLLGIELFILFSKASDGKTDYEKLVEFQTEIREERMKKILENNAKNLAS